MTCGWPYWRKMEPVEEVMAPTTKDGVTKRAAVYEEIVDLPRSASCGASAARHDEGRLDRRRLCVGQAVRGQAVRAGVVTFDTGWLLAAKESIPDEQGGPGTYVEGVKSIQVP